MRIDIYTRTMLDDRGVRRPVFCGNPRLEADSRERLGPVVWQELRRALGAHDGLHRDVTYFVLVAAGFLLAAYADRSFQMLVIGLAFLLILAEALRHRRTSMPRRGTVVIHDALLMLGRCPSCGDLLAEERDQGGCAVCSRCGGVWRPRRPKETCTCGYDLLGLPVDSSGRVRCPECSATHFPAMEG
jgi:hypothetical protein